jgi:hypothetical protein
MADGDLGRARPVPRHPGGTPRTGPFIIENLPPLERSRGPTPQPPDASPAYRRLAPKLEPVDEAPLLWSAVGCGLRLVGWASEPAAYPWKLRLYCVTVLYLPVIPLRTYLASWEGERRYSFRAECGVIAFLWAYRRRLPRYALTMIADFGISWFAEAGALMLALAMAIGLSFGFGLLS